MAVTDTFKDAEQRMKQAIEAMVQDFASYRTGRASPNVLDRVTVLYYGTETALSQVASISVPEPRQLFITPYEKSLIPAIEKAILKSDLNISPVNDGSGIRLNFPQMTEDRRKELAKQVHSRSEEGRVAIRNVRRDLNEKLKAAEKAKEISQDELKGHETKAQKLTDQFVAQIDDLGKKKEAELMTV